MARRLLAWYGRQARALPWRASRDPYRVWISEIMLQQTRVEAVLPYYERFCQRFPDLEALAAAPLQEVLTLWSGLGYYRRARLMHTAARQVAASGGRLPASVEGLRALPGIGAYTAAAIASIAFEIAEPVLDGNVERVLARLLAFDGDPKRAAGKRRLREAAAGLLDPRRPGDSNQALMELGATVCTPRRPRCGACPLASGCAAHRRGEEEKFPVKRKGRETVQLRLAVAVARRGARVLLFRRPDSSDLLAGTWELPWVEVGEKGALPGRAGPEVLEAALGRRYGGRWKLRARKGRVRHAITFRSLTVDVHPARLEAAAEESDNRVESGWFDAAGRRRIPLSSVVEKALRAVGEEGS